MITDTPETDHIENNMGNAAHPVLSSFCRTLERERDEAIAEATNAVNDIICVKWERDEAREQRDRLREALRRLAWVITLPDPIDAVRNIATEVLQSLTPPNNP